MMIYTLRFPENIHYHDMDLFSINCNIEQHCSSVAFTETVSCSLSVDVTS